MTDFTLERLAHDAVSTHSQILGSNGLSAICQSIERQKEGGVHPRIPPGRYPLIRRAIGATHFDHPPHNFPIKYAPWYKGIIEIANVPGRSSIEIHPANWASQLEGCVAPCQSFHHDDDTGWTGVSSVAAWITLYEHYLYPAIEAGDAHLIVRDLD